ncbi:MAG: hypothetical protein ABI132_07880 [Rhodanobacteraceae bacterium]
MNAKLYFNVVKVSPRRRRACSDAPLPPLREHPSTVLSTCTVDKGETCTALVTYASFLRDMTTIARKSDSNLIGLMS